MEGLNRVPREEQVPQSPVPVIENMLSLLTQEAVDIFSSLPLLATREEYENAIVQFNALGTAQLDREDDARRETLESESLAGRQMETVLELPPYGRVLRITRGMNGVVTLASA